VVRNAQNEYVKDEEEKQEGGEEAAGERIF
jgi:hypothetical protein